MKDIFYDLGVLRAFLNSDSFQEAALWMRRFDGYMSNVPRVAFCRLCVKAVHVCTAAGRV